ncbi:MAG: DUF4426 domain-containing protein [Gammaproteobacteria bacterium]|nr:MAG: DUF4426 domain-containing protein [Gammaproteobacteria bacterium]
MILSSRYLSVLNSTVLGFCLLFSSLSLQAEQVLKTKNYQVHYNAFNSAMLTPEIAKQYGIQRSKSLGVLNISILNNSNQSVTALVDGQGKNPISQITTLDFQKVTEGKAIYYIATFSFADKEQLNFKIRIIPDGAKEMIDLDFSQQFFVGSM